MKHPVILMLERRKPVQQRGGTVMNNKIQGQSQVIPVDAEVGRVARAGRGSGNSPTSSISGQRGLKVRGGKLLYRGGCCILGERTRGKCGAALVRGMAQLIRFCPV